MSMGGGGGGGTSGTVTWPAYFTAWHESLLGNAVTFEGTGIFDCMVGVLNTYWTDNPFLSATAYDPSTYLAEMRAATNFIYNLANTLNPVTDWVSYISYVRTELDANVLGTTNLVAAENAYNAVIDADYANVILPRFKRGLQDANAVMSSAYVIGEALLEAEVLRKKATYSADLRLQNYKERVSAILNGTDLLIKLASQEHDFMRGAVTTYVDQTRISIVAKKEQLDRDMALEELDAKWDIEAFTYAGNFLAAGHGASSQSGTKGTAMQSVLGGAMSGASMGTSISPGWGTLIGALGGAAFSAGSAIRSNNA